MSETETKIRRCRVPLGRTEECTLTIACDPTDLKSIRITCRCGQAITAEVPRELTIAKRMGATVFCGSCSQGYCLTDNKLVRFDPNTNILNLTDVVPQKSEKIGMSPDAVMMPKNTDMN